MRVKGEGGVFDERVIESVIEMEQFWCEEGDLQWAFREFGAGSFQCSVKQIGGRHVCVTIRGDFRWKEARDHFFEKWEGTRRMLYQRRFECYLMLDSDGIRRFIGRGGRGIRWLVNIQHAPFEKVKQNTCNGVNLLRKCRYRKLSGKTVFIVPILWKGQFMFDVFTRLK